MSPRAEEPLLNFLRGKPSPAWRPCRTPPPPSARKMRRPLFAANWKMNKTAEETRKFFADFKPRSDAGREIVICPPFTVLALSASLSAGRHGIGAQDLFWEAEGAFTGEISP